MVLVIAAVAIGRPTKAEKVHEAIIAPRIASGRAPVRARAQLERVVQHRQAERVGRKNINETDSAPGAYSGE